MWGSEERARRRRAEEMERRLQELDRIDALYGLGTLPVQIPIRRTARGRRLLTLTVVAALCLGAAKWTGYDEVMAQGVRSALGEPSAPQPEAIDDGTGNAWGDPVTVAIPLDGEHLGGDGLQAGTGLATTVAERRTSRSAPEVVPAGGAFAFSGSQVDGSEPVTWDACQPVPITVNPDGAPEGYLAMLESAISRTRAATGFDITLVGKTSNRQIRQRDASDPVLVLWSTQDEEPRLAGDVAGVAHSWTMDVRPGFERRVTGSIALDLSAYNDPLLSPSTAEAILLHELAHVLGLDHVDDSSQLMNAHAVGVDDFGLGDLEGLARLGKVPCG